MAAIKNDRDLLLQGAPIRDNDPAAGRAILLTADASVIRVSGSTSTPSNVALKVQLINVKGVPTWGVTGATGLTVAGDGLTATLAASAFSGTSAAVTVSITYGGVTYIQSIILQKVSEGGNTAQVYAYQRSATALSSSPGSVTYDFASAAITVPATNALANGWTKTIPAGTDPLYVSVATAYGTGTTDTIAAPEWTAPVKLAENGTSGLNTATVFVYQRTASTSPPALPSADTVYTFATGGLTGLTNGWTRAVPSAGSQYLWCTQATAAATATTDTIAAAEWSAAAIQAANGANGTNGSNGSPGSNGTRGTVTLVASGSSWSNTTANNAISANGSGSPINGDIVTITNGSSFSETRFYSGGSWVLLTAYINGNLLVTGTLSASVINGGTLSGVSIQIGTGNTVNGKAFEVSSGGVVRTDNIFGGLGSFSNFYATSITTLTGVTYGNVECIIGNVAASNAGAGAHGVRGRNQNRGTSGLVGAQNNYDFYADGSGTNYGPFTGAHDALIPLGATITPGDIVVDVECISKNGLSNTIFLVAPSSLPMQKTAIGVWVLTSGPLNQYKPAVFIDYGVGGIDPASRPTYFDVMSDDYLAVRDNYLIGAMNAIGEGQVNVCGENGDIEAGDLIVTSSMPGKGMRQEDDVIRGYTVAKSREAVVFDSPDQVKQVACIYLCG